MYYEEKLINGIWMSRTSPDGEWFAKGVIADNSETLNTNPSIWVQFDNGADVVEGDDIHTITIKEQQKEIARLNDELSKLKENNKGE